jgi:hypothetical protein
MRYRPGIGVVAVNEPDNTPPLIEHVAEDMMLAGVIVQLVSPALNPLPDI